MNIFFLFGRGRGYDEPEDIGGGGIAKLYYFWELFLNILGLFLRSRCRIGIFFGNCYFNCFGGYI